MAAYRFVTLHVSGLPTIERVTYVTNQVHGIYSSFVWVPDRFKGAPTPEALASEDSRRYDFVRAFQNMYLDDDLAISIYSVRMVGSFEISLSGVSDAIDATAEIIDPLRRSERREKLRHEKVMNRFIEAGAGMDNEMKSISVLREKAALLDDLVRQNLMTEAGRTTALRNLFGTQEEAGDLLDYSILEVTASGDDETR